MVASCLPPTGRNQRGPERLRLVHGYHPDRGRPVGAIELLGSPDLGFADFLEHIVFEGATITVRAGDTDTNEPVAGASDDVGFVENAFVIHKFILHPIPGNVH